MGPAPQMKSPEMAPETFKAFRSLILRLSGISLADNKEILLQARITKRMRKLGIPDFEAYLEHVLANEEEVTQFLDVISTNVTSFYRESSHFEFLDKTVKRWLREGRPSLRLWSAACSSGEEPYTLAMTLLEAAQNEPIDFRILATDLSTKVLNLARKGCYSPQQLGQVPDRCLSRYFERAPRARDEDPYYVRTLLKDRITFARFNLTQIPFPMNGPFDVVLCRNVMIYFDAEFRRRLVLEMTRLLRPGGFLLVGHSESLGTQIRELSLVSPSIYART